MSKIKKDIFYQTAYQVLILILPLITAPYISRIIGVEGIGKYSYTYSIAYYFSLFVMLGLNNYGNRSIAIIRDSKKELNKAFWSIYLMQISIGLITTIMYILYILFLAKDNLVIFYIQLFFIIASVVDINWFFWGMENFKITVIRNAVIKFFTTCMIFILVKESSDLWKYALILALGNLASNLVLWPFLPKYIDILSIKNVKFNDIIKHIKPNLILFIPIISTNVYKVIDKVMLGSLSNFQQLGYFENAEKIINIPISILVGVSIVMMPKMSYLLVNNEKEKNLDYLDISMQLTLCISSAFAFGIISIADKFIPIYFGAEFNHSILLIYTLAPMILIIAWEQVIRAQYITPKKRDREFCIAVICGAIVNFSINLLLINTMQSLGTVIGSVLAELIVAIILTNFVKRELPIKEYLMKNVIYILFGIIMYIFVRISFKFYDSIICAIIIGGITYTSLVVVHSIMKKNIIYYTIICRGKSKIEKKMSI